MKIYASLLVLGIVLLQCTSPETSQYEKVWPGQTWEVTTPESVGVNGSVLDSIHNDITQGKYGLIDAFLVIRHGKIIADHGYVQNYDSVMQHYDTANHMYNYDHPDWHPYYKGSRLHTLQSVTKSINSLALGIAMDEGFIKGVESKPFEMFTNYTVDNSDPRRGRATLEDLLTMRSGIDWNEMTSYESDSNTCIIMEKSNAWIQYVLSQPMRDEPGTRWDYNSGVSMLLGKLVGIATGKRVDAWAEEKLFKPIGINEYFWKTTPDNECDTEGGLYLSTHDLARIGYLMLRKGKWGDKQIVSEEWVKKSITPHVPDIFPNNDKPNPGYGYQWWVPQTDPVIFAGNGYGGQFLMVSPKYDLVVVFNGWAIHDAEYPLSSWDALADRIIPSVKL